jgi:membrane protein implicated in regulation of membrane protease activity
VNVGAVILYAHLGHWYIQLLFAAPALLIIALVARDSLRRRRRERRRKPRDPRSPG